MNRFELLSVKHNAEIRRGLNDKKNDITLTRYRARPWHDEYSVITYRGNLTRQDAIAGVALMFGVLEAGWADRNVWFRFAMLGESREVWAAIRRQYRDLSGPIEIASRILVTDRMIHECKLEGREPWYLCETEDVSPFLMGVRLGLVSPRNLYKVPTPHPVFARQPDAAMWCDDSW